MINSIKRFLRDENGFVTIESLVVMGGSVWMAGVVLTDITIATIGVTTRLETRLDYTSIVAEVLQEYGPESTSDSGVVSSEQTGSGSNGEDDCVGNPGNDKCVGNAGENPNGGSDWGSGSNGMSDSGSNPGNSGGSGNNASGTHSSHGNQSGWGRGSWRWGGWGWHR